MQPDGAGGNVTDARATEGLDLSFRAEALARIFVRDAHAVRTFRSAPDRSAGSPRVQIGPTENIADPMPRILRDRWATGRRIVTRSGP